MVFNSIASDGLATFFAFSAIYALALEVSGLG